MSGEGFVDKGNASEEAAVGMSLVYSSSSLLPSPWFCFARFHLPKVSCSPKTLTVKFRNKPLVNVTSGAIPCSIKRSCAVPFHLAQDLNHPLFQLATLCAITAWESLSSPPGYQINYRLPRLSQCLRSSNPYFT